MSESLSTYMKRVGEYSLLTVEEEVELAHKISQGSIEARDMLIQANLRLVVKIAHDYKNRGVGFDDLIANGNIGLIRAAEKFDPSKGAKFSTYSAWWIKQWIRRGLEGQRVIRIPPSYMSTFRSIKKAQAILTKELGRVPFPVEVSNFTQIGIRKVQSSELYVMETSSLNQPMEDGGEVGDLIADESVVSPSNLLISADSIEYMLESINILPERSQKIIELRYGLNGTPPHTLEAVSLLFNLTRERIRQIQWDSLNKLKFHMENNLQLRNKKL